MIATFLTGCVSGSSSAAAHDQLDAHSTGMARLLKCISVCSPVTGTYIVVIGALHEELGALRLSGLRRLQAFTCTVSYRSKKCQIIIYSTESPRQDVNAWHKQCGLMFDA
jgi:hypothetical protein